MGSSSIVDIRVEYHADRLLEREAPEHPLPLFQTWLEAAVQSGMTEPNAMTLATVDARGYPHARMVLLRGVQEETLSFFTNYHSHKSQELDKNPRAEVCFWWPPIQKQVRVGGDIKRLPREESERYFASRPRESQLGAWASTQSEELESRHVLDERFEQLKKKFGDDPVPCPKNWGGYALYPMVFEFWQGRPSRLHDRIAYYKEADGWRRVRLSP